MQIIFDEKLVPTLREKYVVLELDTVMQPDMTSPLTLYALIETINFGQLARLPELVEQHETMVRAYKNNEWDVAEFNAHALKGQWRGEIDEFYDSAIEAISEMRKSKTIWNGVKYTTPKE